MKKAIFALACLAALSASSAFAQIETMVESKDFSFDCQKRMADAIDREDNDGKLHFIGDNATLRAEYDSDEDAGKNVRVVSVTVSNEDDFYSIWNVQIEGDGQSCVVKSVEWEDAAS
jgi:hypothetical protein